MTGLRLEIGCGRKPNPGFKTIDIESYANPDFLGDFRTMSFSDVEEIYSAHLLEHFDRNEMPEIIKLWHSWLKEGGRIVIEVPDFLGICEQMVKDTNPKRRYWLCRHAFGSQDFDWAYHKEGLWDDKLSSLLSNQGFRVLGIYKKIRRGYLPNLIVEAIK